MAIEIVLNGQARLFQELGGDATVVQFVELLGLKADRVAIELNGAIAPRKAWGEMKVKSGDRLELVHFVGGGLDTSSIF